MKGVKKHKKVVNNLLNCSKMNTDMHERYLNRSNIYIIIPLSVCQIHPQQRPRKLDVYLRMRVDVT